jgi:thiamine pyrophosphokinase
MTNETILILADGDWSHLEILSSLVESADHIIAANGGTAHALAHGIRVHEVVGDLDSLSRDDVERLLAAETPTVHAFAPEKDWTDLELAIDHALRRKPRRIHLFGALGTRLDHTLTSVHLLEKGISQGVPIVLFASGESVRLVADACTLREVSRGDRVSLIPISASCTVTTQGLRYPLRREVLRRSASRGVSNEATATPVRIDVAAGLLLVLHAKRGAGDHD